MKTLEKWIIFNPFVSRKTCILREFSAPRSIAIRYFKYLNNKSGNGLEMRTAESFKETEWLY